MKPPETMTQVINGKRYSVKTATLLAGNDYWDGHNYERRGTNTFLFRTPKGAYFAVYLTQWQGQQDHIEALNPDEVLDMYESLREKYVEAEEAFPGITIEEA